MKAPDSLPITPRYDVKILYVEDDVTIRINAKELLSMVYSCIETSPDGSDALNKFLDSDYDLIITDIQMPHMDGIELITQIRKIDPLQKIVVLSGTTDSDVLKQLEQMDICHFIPKPFAFEVLITTLASLFAKPQ